MDVEDIVVDEDRGLALVADVADEFEHLALLRERQAGGRLVEDDQFRR